MTLGIEISVKKDIEKINIEPLINKIENIIKIWSWRHLNSFGKVTVINSLFLSQLIYRFTVLPTPSKSIMDKIDKILFNYLWDNRPHKIAKDVVSNDYQFGGIKMPNIYIKNNALKCSSVDRIYKNPSYILCPTLDLYCYIETKELLKCNLAPRDIHLCWSKQPPQFWVDVLTAWCRFMSQVIWFNSNIRINNNIMYNENMY